MLGHLEIMNFIIIYIKPIKPIMNLNLIEQLIQIWPENLKTNLFVEVKKYFFNNKEIYDVTNYYNKSKNVDDLEEKKKKKRNNISNLNYELNSINNNINYTQFKINAKKIGISNKNEGIIAQNKLADSMIEKGNEINDDNKNAINNGKNQVEQVKVTIQSKKDFFE